MPESSVLGADGVVAVESWFAGFWRLMGIVDPLGSFAIPLGYGELHDIYAHFYALYVASGEGEIALMGERENGSAFCDKC